MLEMLRSSNIAFSGEMFLNFLTIFECKQNCEMVHVPAFKSVIKIRENL